MKYAVDNVLNRHLVWDALSDLFLDTDVSLSRKWRIEKFAASPYFRNLFSVAGEWAGFDQTWLEDRILQRTGSCEICQRFSWGHITVPMSAEWRATKVGIIAARQAPDKCMWLL